MAKETTLLIDDREVERLSFSPVCSRCSRLLDDVSRRCDAFEVIPDVIWDGKVKHKQPFKGDNDLLFKQITIEELNRNIREAKEALA